jgi:hypothetical protein
MTWEGLSVGGKLVIEQILRAIDSNQLLIADLTELNPNVLFELGYGVAQNKRIWLLLDTSITTALAEFTEFRLLTTVGYQKYTNADHVVKGFFKEKPAEDLAGTILERFIKPSLSATGEQKVLYLKSLWDTEASTFVTKRVSRSPLKVTVDDPTESAFQNLVWYGQNAYAASGLICHFTSLNRRGAKVHNAKQAFVSGMAYGFGKPLLMIADEDYLSPIDYRDLLKNYHSAMHAGDLVDQWLQPIETDFNEFRKTRAVHAEAIKLATELSAFQFGLGDYLAENEAEKLEDYFVETVAYREALDGRQTIFVGRKGTGKTANFVKLSSALEQDPDNLVVKITPVAYELEALVSLFAKLQSNDQKGYVIESLWKFLIYTEIGNAAVRKIEARPVWHVASEAEKELVRLFSQEASVMSGDFSVRLERVTKLLLSLRKHESIEGARLEISEALHQSIIGRLRILLGRALQTTQRVSVLVDNLDRAWSQQADIEKLSQFLMGLLLGGPRIAADFHREDPRRKPLNMTLAVFMRADIFARILEKVSEPDKLFFTRLNWDDSELLIRVIEERYEAAHSGSSGKELWNRYFCDHVKGLPTKDYLIKRILPRPRDIVYLVKAAVSNAVNRRHTRVESSDIEDAEPAYSQYAVKSILVENGVTLPELERILDAFYGSSAILTEQEVRSIIQTTMGEKGRVDYVISHLIGLTFLGVEIREMEFEFLEDYSEVKRSFAARRWSGGKSGAQRFKINPAFHAYLEIHGSLP